MLSILLYNNIHYQNIITLMQLKTIWFFYINFKHTFHFILIVRTCSKMLKIHPKEEKLFTNHQVLRGTNNSWNTYFHFLGPSLIQDHCWCTSFAPCWRSGRSTISRTANSPCSILTLTNQLFVFYHLYSNTVLIVFIAAILGSEFF